MKRHLIGIGGAGMSALATLLVRQGDTVTGADRTFGTPNIRFLESLGIRVYPDDGSGVDAATDEVIVSTAIEESNAGLVRAKELGVPVTHRAKALSRALASRKLVAVVGTCGKSTVTAMLGHVLSECGLDPLCVNGANVPGWEGAVRFGAGEYAVAEVDESDRSLVAFKPYAAIVTNASADHYSKEEMDEVFDAFVRDCEGPVVDGRGSGRPIPQEGVASTAGRIVPLEVPTSIPGRHNRQNAALALRMAVALGCDESQARAALLSFKGVERRLQRILPSPPLPPPPSPPPPLPPSSPSASPKIAPAVFDDYAHNPEKIRAMWTTLAEAYPAGICVIWRPHGYAPLRKLLDALAAMFSETVRPCDRLLLLPVYDAGGTADRTISSRDLLAKVRGEAEGRIVLVPDLEGAFDWCAAHRDEYACFATCGARDPGLPLLARRLADL